MQGNVNQSADKTKNNGKWSQSAGASASHEQKAAEDTVAGLSDSARKIYDQAVEKGADFISQANKKGSELVREYPVYATLGGLCVGFLLGASIFSRGSSPILED